MDFIGCPAMGAHGDTHPTLGTVHPYFIWLSGTSTVVSVVVSPAVLLDDRLGTRQADAQAPPPQQEERERLG